MLGPSLRMRKKLEYPPPPPPGIQPNDTRTRGSLRLRQLQATKDVYKFSFYPRTISDWNRLPINVAGVRTFQEFREGLPSLPPQLL